MKIRMSGASKKMAPLFILKILEEYTDEDNTLSRTEICKILEDNGFEIERKAVARYLEDLYDAGYDVRGVDTEGASGKKRSEKVYLERDFTHSELQLLIDSVLFSKHLSSRYAKDLIEKISDLGSKHFSEKNKAIDRVDSVYHAPNAEYFAVVGTLQTAIAEDKTVSFKYSGGSKHKFTVSPYYLAVGNDHYYLICVGEDGKIFHFRLDKIRDVKILSALRKPVQDTPLKGASIGQYLASHPLLFVGEPERVVLKIKNDKMGYLCDTFGNSHKVLSSGDEYSEVALYCNPRDMRYWALQYGEIAEVVAPESLRNEIRGKVAEMAARYGV